MQNSFERFAKIVYKTWKSGRKPDARQHPDEEGLACFIDGKLLPDEAERIKLHLIDCALCLEKAVAHYGLKSAAELAVPQELVEGAKCLALGKEKTPVFEIALRLGERALEVLNTTGDILSGRSLVSAPLLRQRHPKDLKDEIIILKDFRNLRVEVKIKNKRGQAFTLIVMAKERQTGRFIKDLRVTLLCADTELESYIAETGAVTFEHVLLGKYKVELSDIENKIASVILDVKK